jgi:hypothetical protein
MMAMVLVYVGGAIKRGRPGLVVVAAISAILFGAWRWIYLRRAVVCVFPEEVLVQDRLRARRWLRSDVSGVALRRVATRTSPGVRDLAVVHGPHRRALFCLDLADWDLADIDGLSKAMGHVRQKKFTTVTPSQMQEQYPGALSWLRRHPYLSVMGAVAIVVLAIAPLSSVGAMSLRGWL